MKKFSAKRSIDIGLLIISAPLVLPLLLAVALYIKLLCDGGPVLYWSNRVGIRNTIFRMPKFRTMKVATPELASHLLLEPEKYLIVGGSFLRRSSLDELPQLCSILLGQMSFVGPRPALYNQDDLIELRTKAGVHTLRPGLTGWAQVNGRDELAIDEKVSYDAQYLAQQSITFDIKILWLTFLRVMSRASISH